MPSKHSKNNTAKGYFTYHEKKKAGYGSMHARLGKDAMKAFDHCTLCLQPVVQPLCCNEGHIFCKECIYSNLLTQKKTIKKELADWEADQRRIEV